MALFVPLVPTTQATEVCDITDDPFSPECRPGVAFDFELCIDGCPEVTPVALLGAGNPPILTTPALYLHQCEARIETPQFSNSFFYRALSANPDGNACFQTTYNEPLWFPGSVGSEQVVPAQSVPDVHPAAPVLEIRSGQCGIYFGAKALGVGDDPDWHNVPCATIGPA